MKITPAIAHAAARDAGNQHAKEHGRTVWNVDDWNAAAAEYNRLLLPTFAPCAYCDGMVDMDNPLDHLRTCGAWPPASPPDRLHSELY